MIKISTELKELAQIFNNNDKKLYIVGGFVRDSYLGIQSALRDDIDLCSNVTPKQLRKMLEGTNFSVSAINESVGVMAINGKRRYEYATFRKEYYETESHMPDKIEFINSLEEDSRRRDFRINAVYYDILEQSFVDPLGGIEDLKEQKITTVKVPKIVFNDDPERILRLIRFACALGLEIPEEEYYYAKQNAYKVKFMSKSRLKNEFEKLLTCDQIYPELLHTRNAHFRAMVLIGEFDLWKYILPAIDDLKKSQVVDNKGERIYEHTLNSLKNASPKIRLAVLFHDVGKVKTMEQRHNFFGAREFVESIVDLNLGINGLGFSKGEIKRIVRTINGYDFNNYCLASKNTIKKFIFNNKDVIENIIEIKNVVKNESRMNIRKIKSAEKLRRVYNDMLKNGAPFDLRDLNIKGDDIIKANPYINLENLDDLLDKMLELTALKPKMNNKEDLLVLARKVINSKRDYFLEEC